MTDACIIEYKGNRYYYLNIGNEKPDLFRKRCWFLVKYNGKYDNDILIMLSHVYINVSFNGMKYEKKIMDMIQKLENSNA